VHHCRCADCIARPFGSLRDDAIATKFDMTRRFTFCSGRSGQRRVGEILTRSANGAVPWTPCRGAVRLGCVQFEQTQGNVPRGRSGGLTVVTQTHRSSLRCLGAKQPAGVALHHTLASSTRFGPSDFRRANRHRPATDWSARRLRPARTNRRPPLPARRGYTTVDAQEGP
jgi:hypothetical protein